MLKEIKCNNCGIPKTWKESEGRPEWFVGIIENPYIISPKDHGLTIVVQYCSKKCKREFENGKK